MTNESQIRAAVIAALAEKYPTGNFGRTAVMKLCYFLQTLRQVPLGYRFSLYSYGPFDSEVLSDLDYAEAVGAISSEVVHFPSGAYGYRITPTGRSTPLNTAGKDFVEAHSGDLDWVIGEFGDMGSADLELASTIIFADREVTRRGATQSHEELVDRVHAVKPHFNEQQISNLANRLAGRNFLKSVA